MKNDIRVEYFLWPNLDPAWWETIPERAMEINANIRIDLRQNPLSSKIPKHIGLSFFLRDQEVELIESPYSPEVRLQLISMRNEPHCELFDIISKTILASGGHRLDLRRSKKLDD